MTSTDFSRPFRRVVWLLWLFAAVPCIAQTEPRFASTQAAPRVEYWQRRQADIEAALARKSELPAVRLVFIGDSITDFWLLDDSPWVRGQKYGLPIWQQAFGGTPPENRALNLGISGDRIEHVLYRLQPRAQGGLGQLDAPELQPEFFVVMLGINNTWAAEDPVADSVFEGVRTLLLALHELRPNVPIILQSLLPTNDAAKNAEVVRPVNARLLAWAQSGPLAGKLHTLDLHAAFLDANGAQIGRLFTDGLHPNRDGYAVWRDRLLPFLVQTRAQIAAANPGSARPASAKP